MRGGIAVAAEAAVVAVAAGAGAAALSVVGGADSALLTSSRTSLNRKLKGGRF